MKNNKYDFSVDKGIKCPTCPNGYLRLAKHRQYWYCSSYKDEPVKCSEIFLNVSGKPYLEKCPACHKGYIRKSRSGHLYCSNSSGGCMANFVEVDGMPTLVEEIKCPICNMGILRRTPFENWSCSNWKKGCKAIFENVDDKPYLGKCVVCKVGYMRKTKSGRWFCTNFKNCNAFYVEKNRRPVLKYDSKEADNEYW